MIAAAMLTLYSTIPVDVLTRLLSATVIGAESPAAAQKPSRSVYFAENQGATPCAIYDRYRLRPGWVIEGPAGLGPEVAAIVKGYTFTEPAIELGVLVENDEPVPSAVVRIPLGMLNRHGLVAGATGTGKTKTLQLMAEQISAAGVPVFAADMKGDLSGIAAPGQTSDKLQARTRKIGQDWQPRAAPTETGSWASTGRRSRERNV